MSTEAQPKKLNATILRALPGYKRLLERREAGLSVQELALLEGLGTAEIYARLKRAKDAKGKGWI